VLEIVERGGKREGKVPGENPTAESDNYSVKYREKSGCKTKESRSEKAG